jgi:hypothetical protein
LQETDVLCKSGYNFNFIKVKYAAKKRNFWTGKTDSNEIIRLMVAFLRYQLGQAQD